MNKEIIRDYNASACLYDERYEEEQSLKISFIMKKVRPNAGDAVIDVGCGTGALLGKLDASGLHVGLDASVKMLEEARRKGVTAELVLGDAQALPFKEGCFDRAYSVSVFQLLDDSGAAASEMMRVLKVGGSFAVSVLLKLGTEKITKIVGYFGLSTQESYESESMKDVFLLGKK